jgi:Clostripain family
MTISYKGLLFLFITIIIVTSSTFSLSYNRPAFAPSPRGLNNIGDYTVLIYMIGSSDLASPQEGSGSKININEMEAIGSSSKINVIIQTGGGIKSSPIDDHKFIDFTVVQRHKILKNGIQNLGNLGKRDMADPKTLTDFIIWGMSNFPAKKYAIILWDHGSGINGFGNDALFNHDILKLSEMVKAFADAKKITNKNFELIGFDACLMASVEVANMISSFGNYMVASEEDVPLTGWNYSSILEKLTKYPESNGSSLGKTMADSYLKYYNSEINQKTVTLSVINLTKVSQITNGIEELSNYMNGKIVNTPSAISIIKAADSTERFGQTARNSSGLVDLYDLLSHIKIQFPDTKYLCESIQRSLKSSIIYNINGKARANATGLSIYMPTKDEDFSDSVKYTMEGWQKIINRQYYFLKLDKDGPIIDVSRNGDIITGHIKGGDISKVQLFISTDPLEAMEGGKEISFLEELDPSQVIKNDGSFEYKWNRQIISLCSEEKCIPSSMFLKGNDNKKFAYFEVSYKEYNMAPINRSSLIYEIKENGPTKKFDFLGIRASPDIGGTVAKQLTKILPNDTFYTYAMELSPSSKSNGSLILLGPLEIHDVKSFGPKYHTYTGKYNLDSLTLYVCDYSNNCKFSFIN